MLHVSSCENQRASNPGCSKALPVCHTRPRPPAPRAQALSWALNRGPLCMPGLTPIQFLAVYATPVTPVASTGQSTSGQPLASKGHASAAAGSAGGQSSDGSGGSAATRQAGGGEPPLGGRVAEAYPAQRMPRVGSQGRLGEDAGSSTGMLLSWLGKLALIAIMVWVMQQPLPGLARSFAYGGCANRGHGHIPTQAWVAAAPACVPARLHACRLGLPATFHPSAAPSCSMLAIVSRTLHHHACPWPAPPSPGAVQPAVSHHGRPRLAGYRADRPARVAPL